MMTPTDREAELCKNEEKKWNPFEKLCGLRRESPEFRRCCFCVPLRRGLVGWGYLKVALNMWAMGWLVYYNTFYYKEMNAAVMVQIVLLLADAAVNVLFIFGGHQKNMKFLTIAYIYSFVWLAMELLVLSWLVSRDMRRVILYIREHEHYSYILAIFCVCVMFSVFVLCGWAWCSFCAVGESIIDGITKSLTSEWCFVQIYWILLIRSLLAKLQDHTLEFQFNNRAAADAQCTLHKHNTSVTDISATDGPDVLVCPPRPAASVESTSSRYVKQRMHIIKL